MSGAAADATATLIDELAVDGPAAPPRSNGELVFAAPWESRVFGLAMSLADQGAFTLADFQGALIGAIADWEVLGLPSDEYRYYDCWLLALERLVERSTTTRIADVDTRAAELMERPAGHDHNDHDHNDHDQGHHHDHHHHDR